MDNRNIKTNKLIWIIIDIILFCILVCIDQFTKRLALNNLMGNDGISIIENVFSLYYVENRGAAFGIMQNGQMFFIIVAIIILLMILYLLAAIPAQKKYNLMHIFLTIISAGAVGNLIDRITNGYVIDFLYFELIDFPVFNVADIYVTCSAFIFIILFMFYYKEDDLSFIYFWSKNAADESTPLKEIAKSMQEEKVREKGKSNTDDNSVGSNTSNKPDNSDKSDAANKKDITDKSEDKSETSKNTDEDN